MPRPFKSELIITEEICDITLRAYNVGFDQNRFRLEPLAKVIMSTLAEFVFGLHEGSFISQTEIYQKLVEAAKRLYSTPEFLSRGEFGELILHLLLRDFCGSIPLVSKIYFKDSDNATVHGFDGVHVVVDGASRKLWLGESKLYTNGKKGVRALIKDLKDHLKADYLRREFALVSPKIPSDYPERNYWVNLINENQRLDVIFNSISIPMVCTYSSPLFQNHSDNTQVYLSDFKKECELLHEEFKDEKKGIATNIDVLLMLLPVPCKNELVTELHRRLNNLQKA